MTEEKMHKIMWFYIVHRKSFYEHVKHLNKVDMLDLIEFAQAQMGIKRHQLINAMRTALIKN